MNFLTYLFQFSMSFIKFFSTQSLKLYQQNRHNYFNSKKQEKITKQCKKAAQEITYLKSFNHWPIAASKKAISEVTLKYINEKYKIDNIDTKYVDQIILIKYKTDLYHL